MIFEEKKISSERIYEGAILNVRRDKVTAIKGEAYREIVEHNGAVGMVALTENGGIIMEKQYRYPPARLMTVRRILLQPPAGSWRRKLATGQKRLFTWETAIPAAPTRRRLFTSIS